MLPDVLSLAPMISDIVELGTPGPRVRFHVLHQFDEELGWVGDPHVDAAGL
jgi:hypothetical protein